ncbi:MAG: hypothetical protein IT305_15820 [Chloroflexi bacterium]|nr:hypothetical protein [Chloroflexota bacterium]
MNDNMAAHEARPADGPRRARPRPRDGRVYACPYCRAEVPLVGACEHLIADGPTVPTWRIGRPAVAGLPSLEAYIRAVPRDAASWRAIRSGIPFWAGLPDDVSFLEAFLNHHPAVRTFSRYWQGTCVAGTYYHLVADPAELDGLVAGLLTLAERLGILPARASARPASPHTHPLDEHPRHPEPAPRRPSGGR